MEIGPLQGVGQAPTNHLSAPGADELAQNRQLVQAVRAVNQAAMLGDNRELTFMMDRQSQRPVIQIVDRKTKEVVDQIPPEYVLRVAEDLRKL